MKKLIFGLVLFFICLFYYGCTVQSIEKIEIPDDVSMAGGGYSHADIKYVDYRPLIKDKEHNHANVWWETKSGEWRRLETQNYNAYTETVKVLRDKAFTNSWRGVSRGSDEASHYQKELDTIKKDYNDQSFFDRVWIWQIKQLR